MKKPAVNQRCVAATHAAQHERIVEFHAQDENGTSAGGLMSLRMVKGRLVIEIYRQDANVLVVCDPRIVRNADTFTERPPK